MAVVFKSDVDARAEAAMDKFDTELRSKVSTLGLCNISVINPVYGVALAMADVVDVRNVESLVYSHTAFGETLGRDKPKITASAAAAYLSAINVTSSFTWNASDATLLNHHKERVAGRLMHLVNWGIALYSSSAGGHDNESDDPIAPEARTSCENGWVKMYGEKILPRQLASGGTLGRVHRGIGGVLPVVDLTKVVAQDALPLRSTPGFTFDGSVKGTIGFKRKERTSRVNTVADFINQLQILMTTYAFCCVNSLAPVAVWLGAATLGVVRGVRLQLSRQGASEYVDFWRESVRGARDEHVAAIMETELKVRQLWVNLHRELHSIQSCIVESLQTMRATVQVESDKWKRSKQPDVWSPQRGPFGKGKGGGGQYHSPGKGGKLGGKRVQFVQKLKSGGKICYYHNTGTCEYGKDKCKWAHVCDFKMDDGSACGSDKHTRFEHEKAVRAPAVPAAGEEDDEEER